MKTLLAAALANVCLLTAIAIPIEAIAQTNQLKQAPTSSRDYIIFSDSPNSCAGQLVDDGRICVVEFPQEQRPFHRVARLGISDSIVSFETLNLIEFEPNEANIAFLFVMDRHVRSSLLEPSTKFPVVRAYIRTDGAVSIDSDYGEFPPGFSPEEESARMVEMHRAEIQMLISALMETR